MPTDCCVHQSIMLVGHFCIIYPGYSQRASRIFGPEKEVDCHTLMFL